MDEREEVLDETMADLEGEMREGGGFIAGIIFGVMLGAGLALMFAPERGDQTRRRVGRRLRSLRHDAARQVRRELRRRRR